MPSPSTHPSRDAIDIASSLVPNGVEMGTPNATNGVSNSHSNGKTNGKPKNWIPIAEHVLWKPERKVKIISIGCGFSGESATPCQQNLPLTPGFLDRPYNGTKDPECVQDG
jgi:hypothetical protein